MTVTLTTHENIVEITNDVYDDISKWPTFASYSFKLGDQVWFWTPEWQAGEKEATAEIQKGQLSKKLHNAKEIRDYLSSL